MLVAFVTPWIIFYITVGSGFIKLFTYVIQSSSIKMLGFYCEIFVILKCCMKIFLTWLLSVYKKRCYYCVPEGQSYHRSFITYQAARSLESILLLQFQHTLFQSTVLNCWPPASMQALTSSENYFSIKDKAQSWNVNNISLKLALLLLKLKLVALCFLFFSFPQIT